MHTVQEQENTQEAPQISIPDLILQGLKNENPKRVLWSTESA
nr:MAG TPA: hypothetical protein [Caudoviricetes sp.]